MNPIKYFTNHDRKALSLNFLNPWSNNWSTNSFHESKKESKILYEVLSIGLERQKLKKNFEWTIKFRYRLIDAI